MGLAITKIEIKPQQLSTGERFKIQVVVKKVVQEPEMYRLPIRLGAEKGVIK